MPARLLNFLSLVVVFGPPIYIFSFITREPEPVFYVMIATFVLAFGSMWLRGIRFEDLGFRRPEKGWSWAFNVGVVGPAVLLGVALGAGILLEQGTGIKPQNEELRNLVSDWKIILFTLATAWITAALGEELLFRGFLMNSLYDLLIGRNRDNPVRWVIALLISSVIFGAAHFAQGLGGQILTGLIGLCLGILYLFSGRNIWPVVIAHGLFNTIMLFLVYLAVQYGAFPNS